MQYNIALARKYRPSKLSDVIGQDVVIQTIKNAISFNRIHHAFLFTGTRGIGKTTIARIIALILNCSNCDNETLEPCLECDQCLNTLSNKNPDVIEFDAASNTGVESAREIIEQCQYQPVAAKYKIYIIDEVHMMSKSAFNALLKTLEEPPERIKFIFATTELKKIPITIVSRCQKFFLRNVEDQVISQLLKKIANIENITGNEKVFALLAKYANGSVRDAISLLDQAINLSIGTRDLNEDLIKNMLSITDTSLIINLFYDCYLGNTKEALNIVNEFNKSNIEVSNIAANILNIICDSMLFVDGNIDQNFDDNLKNILVKLQESAVLNIPRLLRMWQVVTNSLETMKYISSNAYLTSIVFKLCYSSTLPTPVEMLKLIDNELLKEAVSTIPNTKIIK